MRYSSLCTVAAAALMLSMASAKASVPVYQFGASDSPNDLDGFASNSGGSLVVTHTTNPISEPAMMLAASSSGFKGALTSSVPAIMNNSSVTSISVDVTVPATFTYTGTFADLGITIFVESPSESEFGLQYQVLPADEQNIDLTPGTTTTVTIPLTGDDPDTGNPETYGQLLTTGGTNGEGFVPTGFEFFLDENAANQVELANVQANLVPEPASIGLLASGLGLLFLRRRSVA